MRLTRTNLVLERLPVSLVEAQKERLETRTENGFHDETFAQRTRDKVRWHLDATNPLNLSTCDFFNVSVRDEVIVIIKREANKPESELANKE